MQIFKNLEEHVEHIALVILVTVLSMIAYFLTSPQPPRERTKSAFAGGVIDVVDADLASSIEYRQSAGW